jgi:hypothetical protein
LIALGFVPTEVVGLAGDITIDELKGEDWADESVNECDKRPINPLPLFRLLASVLAGRAEALPAWGLP